MKIYLIFFLILFSLTGCINGRKANEPSIISMQLIDRNGFAETISTKDRIEKYKTTNFLDPQPYQKVLRVYSKTNEGKNTSILTTYHPNGHIWQYLEVIDGRANGAFKEWHLNGQLKMHLHLIEGFADLQDSAQRTWVFDGINKIWDESGNTIAEIAYEKGMLHDPSVYYYPTGSIKKVIPYFRNEVEGEVLHYYENGNIFEKIFFKNGLREGKALAFWENGQIQYEENYENDLLLEGKYFDQKNISISQIHNGKGFKAIFEKDLLLSLIEFQKGKPQGKVFSFNEKGQKTSMYHQVDGKKNGEEEIYFNEENNKEEPRKKISLFWEDDFLQGEVKTWYENGVLESQRQFHQNQKHGVSLAWYKSGEIMLMEEYENNKLIKGSYFKKNDKKAVSKIENGRGIATLYSADGIFQKKITYEKGLPSLDGAAN